MPVQSGRVYVCQLSLSSANPASYQMGVFSALDRRAFLTLLSLWIAASLAVHWLFATHFPTTQPFQSALNVIQPSIARETKPEDSPPAGISIERPMARSTTAPISSGTASSASASTGVHGSFHPTTYQGPPGTQREQLKVVSEAAATSPMSLTHNLHGAWLSDPTSGRVEKISSGPVPRQSILLPILMYHHVKTIDKKLLSDPLGRELTLPPSEFEWQLRYFMTRGFETITMADIALYFQGRTELPKLPVILTFDDGYDDNYLFAFQLLRRYGLKGTFFITTNLTGQEGYMTWQQLRWMAANGMEIGSHLMSHSDLVRLPVAERERELRGSKAILEDEIGKSIRSLSYPGGAFNADVAALARKTGYDVAVTTQYGALHDRSKPLELSRIRISGWESPDSFQSKIEHFFPVGGAVTK